MKALVTGGTGFVGSHIVRALLDANHSVRVLHRHSSKLDALNGLDIEPAIGELDDIDTLKTACANVDWVFHVAAIADYWRADQSRMMDVNVEGTRRVLQAAHASGVGRVIFTSSAATVGLREDGQPADETVMFNLKPSEFGYAHSKVLAEAVVQEAVNNGQDVVTVKPSVVMGPGDLNMISGTFIAQIKKMGMFVPVTSGGVGVTDVRDVARWQIVAAEKGRTGESYILNTANYSYREWYGMIAETVGVRKPFFPAPDFAAPLTASLITLLRKIGINTPIDATQARMGTQKVYFDASKAHNELGEPRIDMHQSLKDTYAWYREHGYL